MERIGDADRRSHRRLQPVEARGVIGRGSKRKWTPLTVPVKDAPRFTHQPLQPQIFFFTSVAHLPLMSRPSRDKRDPDASTRRLQSGPPCASASHPPCPDAVYRGSRFFFGCFYPVFAVLRGLCGLRVLCVAGAVSSVVSSPSPQTLPSSS
jgi:hypothetical protein